MSFLWTAADPFPALLKNMAYKQSVETNGWGIMSKTLAKEIATKKSECTN